MLTGTDHFACECQATFYGFGSNSRIVAKPFDELDIESRSSTYGVRIDRPFKRSLKVNSKWYLTGEWRQSNTELLGIGFSFVEGPDDGDVRIAVLRTGFEHTRRTPDKVLSGRAQLSVGLDALGATSGTPGNDGEASPQADFLVFLGQLQWAQRLPYLDSRLVSRFDFQLSNEPLFGAEQFPIGGRWTVRGYRENSLSRDTGAVASVEWKVPVSMDTAFFSNLEIGAFVDWSYSRNNQREEIGPSTISSAGLGLTWNPAPQLEVEALWGSAFEDIDYPGSDELQDKGVHLKIRWSL